MYSSLLVYMCVYVRGFACLSFLLLRKVVYYTHVFPCTLIVCHTLCVVTLGRYATLSCTAVCVYACTCTCTLIVRHTLCVVTLGRYATLEGVILTELLDYLSTSPTSLPLLWYGL